MAFTAEQLRQLDAPLNRDNVKHREQGGKKLSYVEAWHAIAEANRIFGFDAWTRETVILTETNRELVELKGSNGPYKQWRVGYLAKVRITVGDVVREGTGFGSGMGKPEALGDAIESAAKEAESDAMKRALMTFGNPFGLALYDKDQANVADAPPLPSAADAAISVLQTFGDSADAFKETWLKNKDNWKRVMSDADYRRVTAVMKEMAAKFAPAEPKTNGHSPNNTFGLNGDEIPAFN